MSGGTGMEGFEDGGRAPVHFAGDQRNDFVNSPDKKVGAPAASHSLFSCGATSGSSILNRLRGKIQTTFSSKSFQLPYSWVVGNSRYVKVKKAGVTYAVLSNKTLSDSSYCFRVRRDEEANKVFFTPMAPVAADAPVGTPRESELLPDIVTHERESFRAAVVEIFKDAGEAVEPELIEKIVSGHAHEWTEYLLALRALHPPAHSRAPSLPPLLGENAPADDCDSQHAPLHLETTENQIPEDGSMPKDDFSEEEAPTSYVISPPLPLQEEEELQSSVEGHRAPPPPPQQQQQQQEEEGEVESRKEGMTTDEKIQLQDVVSLRCEVQVLHEDMERIMEENCCLNKKTEELRHERDDLRERVDSLFQRVTELHDYIDATERAHLEQLSLLQEKMRTESAAVAAEAQRAVLEGIGQPLQAQIAHLSDALVVSQKQSTALLSILDLRERQLAAEREWRQEQEATASLRCCGTDKSHEMNPPSSGVGNGESSLQAQALPLPSDKPIMTTAAVSPTIDDGSGIDALLHSYRQNDAHTENKKMSGQREGSPHANTRKSRKDSPNEAEGVCGSSNAVTCLKLYTLKRQQGERSVSRSKLLSRTFQHSPWFRGPYPALGYTNETLYHQHTPDRGVGVTTLPPKVGFDAISSSRSNSRRRFHTPQQKTRCHSSTAVRRGMLELHVLAQPPEK